MATTKFLEPGMDATQDGSFFAGLNLGIGSTAAYDSSQAHAGPGSMKCVVTNSGQTASPFTPDIVSDAGACISAWFRFSTVTPATLTNFLMVLTSANGSGRMGLGVNTNGTINFANKGSASQANGSTTLVANTWYRISLSYTDVSTSTWAAKAYINGVLEINASAGVQGNGSANSTASVSFGQNASSLGSFSTPGISTVWVDSMYIDNRTDLTDCGAVDVIAKRPNANGTTNGFTTQIGAGGSGYGLGHSPQVNERPLSSTNGWSMVGAGSAVTEEYTIESAATGDVDISAATIVDFMGWVYSKALASETGSIIVAGASSNISLTSTNTMFTKAAGSTTYPAGGTDIGIITTTALTTVSLYEAGIIIAYIPSGGTLHTQSVNGTFSSSGVLNKLTARTHTASFSTVGVFTWLFARLFTGGFSGAGNLNRATTKSAFTAQFSSTGSLNKQQQRMLTATFSAAGQLVARALSQLLTATFSISGVLNRRAARTLTASHSAAGTLTKQTNKTPFTATFSSSGTVSGAHGVTKLLTATYIASGQLTNRTLTRAFTATYSAAGSLIRLISRPLAGTFSTSGILSRSSSVVPFVATLVASGTLSRLPGKSLGSTYSASGQLTKQPNRSFTATFSSAGSLIKSLARVLVGVFSDSGSLAGVKIGGHNQTFTATFSAAGNIISRTVGRQHTAIYQTSGNLSKTTARRLTATASAAGNLVGNKIMHKALTATFSTSGTLMRTAGKLLTASYRTFGSLLNSILPGPIKLPAHWTHVDTGNPTAYTQTAKNGTQWQQRDDGADTAWKQTGGDKS